MGISLKNLFSGTTQSIGNKLWQNGHYMNSFQNYICWPHLPTKMALSAKLSFNIGPMRISLKMFFFSWITNSVETKLVKWSLGGCQHYIQWPHQPTKMAATSKLSLTNHPKFIKIFSPFGTAGSIGTKLWENVRSNGFNVFFILATVCKVSDYTLLGASSFDTCTV